MDRAQNERVNRVFECEPNEKRNRSPLKKIDREHATQIIMFSTKSTTRRRPKSQLTHGLDYNKI